MSNFKNIGIQLTASGSIALPLEHYLDNYITPEMFGAIGNGVTDDTAAFNAAIQANPVVKALSPKNYRIDGQAGTFRFNWGTEVAGSTATLLAGSTIKVTEF